MSKMIYYRTQNIDGLWAKVEEREFDIKKFIHRSKFDLIKNRFYEKNIELIIGPRQSGKTTIMFMLIFNLLQHHNIKSDQIFYISLDSIFYLSEFENPMFFLRKLKDFYSKEKRIFLFIDEIQRLKNPGKFLKGIYDLDKNIKIFVTGSSSLEIKAKIKEFLTGRKKESLILPISFKEYLDDEKAIKNLKQFENLSIKSLQYWLENENLYGKYLSNRMNEFAILGSYPAILNQNKNEKKKEELWEIYNSYIKKDIVDFMNIAKVNIYNNLVKTLSSQIGNLINKSEISSLIGSNMLTISKYINILQETYVIYQLPPYVSNRRNEIKSTHKCYFLDNGIRNLSINQFSKINDRADKGALLENIVFNEFMKNKTLDEEIYFWRTKAGAEMDFVLQKDNEIIPVELKAGTAKNKTLSKSFYAFLNHFKPRKAIFLNRDYFGIKVIDKTNVFFIPIHWFLLFGTKIVC